MSSIFDFDEASSSSTSVSLSHARALLWWDRGSVPLWQWLRQVMDKRSDGRDREVQRLRWGAMARGWEKRPNRAAWRMKIRRLAAFRLSQQCRRRKSMLSVNIEGELGKSFNFFFFSEVLTEREGDTRCSEVDVGRERETSKPFIQATSLSLTLSIIILRPSCAGWVSFLCGNSLETST